MFKKLMTAVINDLLITAIGRPYSCNVFYRSNMQIVYSNPTRNVIFFVCFVSFI